MPLCYVAAGDFKMGTDSATDPYYDPACDLNQETPIHTNRTGNYYIGRYEITNAQFAKFMTDGGYSTIAYWTQNGWNWKNLNSVTQPDHWNDPAYPIGDAYPNYPVAGVSGYECYAYANYIKGRLVREPEWEKAGRGTDARIYTYGDAYNEYIYSAFGAEPVGTFPESDSVYGVADLEGNIFEWVSDAWESGVYERYASGSFDEPTSGSYQMQRGYRYLVAGDCGTDYATRLSYRDTWPRTYRWTFLGFRVAFNPPT
jgi:iron(II)-dependent oxidoreductase